MKLKFLIIILAALTVMGVFLVSCKNEKIVQQEIYLLYRDIYGNAEFEADGDYPPPDNLDNFDDGLITVTLRFGETIDIFTENDVYGYFITVDQNPYNYSFKFIPDGNYWLEAEFVVLDSCFYDKTDKFFHSDTADTIIDLHPEFLGVNRGCFDLILSGVSEGEYVQVGERFYVRKEVYDRFYKNRESSDTPTVP
ncbi:MAG TPA: hypothetical protein VM123_19255 [archaeon]|nr:hypothetical protein [archaeon]